MGADRGDMTMVNEGIEACWLAVTLDPNWILPWTEIGLIHLRVGRAAEAVKHLLAVRPECGPLDSRYHSTLGTAYWRLGQPNKALAAYEAALELDPEDLSRLEGRFRDSARDRRPRQAPALLRAEPVIWESLRKPKSSWSCCGSSVSQSLPAMPQTSTTGRSPLWTLSSGSILTIPTLTLSRGQAHFAKGNEPSAMADLDAVIRLDPNHAGAHYLRGVLCGNRNQWDQTIADMSEGHQAHP